MWNKKGNFYWVICPMQQKLFAEDVRNIIKDDPLYLGLAAAGSWITNEMDEYSDLDLVLITSEKIGGNVSRMMPEAARFGTLLSAFTGEHVGEKRLLVCLYDNPIIHVDLKFLTVEELEERIEDPVILFERDSAISNVLRSSHASWPEPDLQWIEDRIWTWVHYMAGKIGRGEYFETLSSFDFIRTQVLSPMMQLAIGVQPRGLRRIEWRLNNELLNELLATVTPPERISLLKGLRVIVDNYLTLRGKLSAGIQIRGAVEKRSLEYLGFIEARFLTG
jgi:hypothetical protein